MFGAFAVIRLSASIEGTPVSLRTGAERLTNPLNCELDDAQMHGTRFGQTFDVIPSTVENALEMDTSHLDPHQMKLIKAIVAWQKRVGGSLHMIMSKF